MRKFQLTLLGGFGLRDVDGAELRLPTRKAEALLAYLALASRRDLQRETLAALLWGTASEQGALASLRQTLSLIGKACGREALQTVGRSVALTPGAFSVDALALEAAVTPVNGTHPVDAQALYRGELLAGLMLAEPQFEDWLHTARHRARESAIQALSRQTSDHRQAGRADQAAATCMRLLEIDPLLESAHRQLMQLYAQQGRRAAALRQYQVCVNVLERELDAEPELATRQLYNLLLRQQRGEADNAAPQPGSPMPPPSPPSSGAPVHEAPLVGREDELAQLLASLADARAGHGRVLALLGEAGLGKTRLVEETAVRATQAGMTLLIGHGHESQQLFPLAPWVALMRAAGLATDTALLRTLVPAWRAELEALLPELGGRAELPDDDDLAPARQARLFEAVVQWLALVSQRAPTVLVIEDLHWTDETSLRLLATVARRAQGWPLLLLLTSREEVLQTQAPLRRTLRELAQLPRFQRIDLRALSQAETTTLLAALLGSGAKQLAGTQWAGTQWAEHVWTTSEGNPFVVVEIVRQVGSHAPHDSGLSLPERVRELIRSHLESLSPHARQLVTVAAVAGRECDFALLQTAAGQAEAVAADAVEELVRRRVLRLVGESFDFTHARIRQAVLAELLEPSRRAVHLAIAQALEHLHGHRLPAVSDALAYHYGHTLHHAKAVTYLRRLALRAAHDGAHNEALNALDQALDHLTRGNEPGFESTRLELVLRKGRSLFFLGRFTEVLSLLLPEQARVDAAADPRMAAAYYLRLGSTQTYLGGHAGAVDNANRALQEASACQDHATMGKAHFLLALESFWARPTEGVQHGEQAVALLQATPERWWLGQACWILGLNLSYRGRFAEALAMEARSRALADESADRRLASYAAWTTGFILTLAGDLDPAVAACRESVALALDPLNRMTSLGMLALALVERHDTAEACAVLDEAIPQAVQFRIPHMHGLFLAFRGEAALQAGDLAAARGLAEQGADITRNAKYIYGLGWAQRVLGRIALASGDRAAAQDWFLQAIRTFGDMGAPYEAGRTRLEMAAWLLDWQQPDDAAPWAREGLAALNTLQLHAQAARYSAPGHFKR